MKNGHARNDRISRRVLLTAMALAVAATVSLPQAARADRIELPPMPSSLRVEAGNKPYLVGHAVGTQNYICLPSGWTLFGPQATLFDDGDKQLITHFLSPNPDEGGTPRAAWQHSRDTSAVWALATVIYSEPDFVAPGAIPWLLLRVVGADEGPNHGDKLTETTFIQRLSTAGGVAPSTGCRSPADVGKKALVPYTTDYFFYKAAGGTRTTTTSASSA